MFNEHCGTFMSLMHRVYGLVSATLCLLMLLSAVFSYTPFKALLVQVVSVIQFQSKNVIPGVAGLSCSL